MPIDQLITVAQLGGFVFAATVLGYALKTLFDAWRQGALVSRPIHDAQVKLLSDANAVLRQDLHDNTTVTDKLATAVEAQRDEIRMLRDELTRHDVATRERVAAIQAAVQNNQAMLAKGGGG